MTKPRYTILVVDDIRELRDLLRINLELDGRFEVVGEAENGIEAVECAEKHQPDVVLLDVAMPVRDGIEVLPEIRAVAPGTKVVILSAFDARRLERTALERGAVRYLEKSMPPEALVEELALVAAA